MVIPSNGLVSCVSETLRWHVWGTVCLGTHWVTPWSLTTAAEGPFRALWRCKRIQCQCETQCEMRSVRGLLCSKLKYAQRVYVTGCKWTTEHLGRSFKPVRIVTAGILSSVAEKIGGFLDKLGFWWDLVSLLSRSLLLDESLGISGPWVPRRSLLHWQRRGCSDNWKYCNIFVFQCQGLNPEYWIC